MAKFSNNPRILKAKLVRYENLLDITSSIHLVTLAKLQKLKKKIAKRHISLRFVKSLFRTYYKIYNKQLSDSDSDTDSDSDSDDSEDLDDSYDYEQTLIVVFTSDKSCCGSINHPLISYTHNLILSVDQFKIITIGKKGFNILKHRYKLNIIRKIYDLQEFLNINIASYLVTNEILDVPYNDCYIVFPRFVNMMVQEVVSYKFPSFFKFFNLIFSDRDLNLILDIFIESRKLEEDRLVKDLYDFSVCLLLLDSFQETGYSLLAAKAKAMDVATQSISETIDILRLRYNKARQSVITNEIIEILNASIAILEK